MKTFLTIMVLLTCCWNCDGPDEARSASPLDLTCAGVYYESGGSIERCENAEVICYLKGDDISCLKK